MVIESPECCVSWRKTLTRVLAEMFNDLDDYDQVLAVKSAIDWPM